MKTEETTIMYPLKYRLRFRYFESGHTCGIKVKPQNRDRRILCDCKVFYGRQTRTWYKPIMWLGNLNSLRYWKVNCFIRKNITCD